MSTIDKVVIYAYASIKNALIMLNNRGYKVYDEKNIKGDEKYKLIDDELEKILGNIHVFNETYDDNMFFIFENDNKDKIFLQLFKNDLKKIIIVNKINEIIENNTINSIVCIGNEFPKNLNVELSDKNKIIIEFFKISELKIDVIRHELIPQHILLSNEEKKNFLDRTKFKESELPKIFITDRICRYYGGKVDDIFHISRKNMNNRIKNSGHGFFYRIVVLG